MAAIAPSEYLGRHPMLLPPAPGLGSLHTVDLAPLKATRRRLRTHTDETAAAKAETREGEEEDLRVSAVTGRALAQRGARQQLP